MEERSDLVFCHDEETLNSDLLWTSIFWKRWGFFVFLELWSVFYYAVVDRRPVEPSAVKVPQL